MGISEFKPEQTTILSDLRQFSKKIRQRNAILFYCGMCMLVFFIFFMISILLCRYSIYELCHWLKPGKFAFSFAVYAFTIGWYLDYLKDSLSKTTVKTIAWAIAVIIFLEMAAMLTQSGMASAFYSSLHISELLTESIEEKLYMLVNGLILINTGVAVFITTQFFKPIQLKPDSYLWSIRASFIIFLLSCFLGFLMVAYYGQTHLNPGSLSLPLTHFSTVRQNLISAHFFGIHSIQLLPLGVYYLQNYIGKKFVTSVLILYFSVSVILLIQLIFTHT